MEEKTKIKGCKYCFWKLRKGKYSSCKRKLPSHIPKSAELKYRFMLVEKYNNKFCYNFLNYPSLKERKLEVAFDTERMWK